MRQTELNRLVAELSGGSNLAIESRRFSIDLADFSGALEQ